VNQGKRGRVSPTLEVLWPRPADLVLWAWQLQQRGVGRCAAIGSRLKSATLLSCTLRTWATCNAPTRDINMKSLCTFDAHTHLYAAMLLRLCSMLIPVLINSHCDCDEI